MRTTDSSIENHPMRFGKGKKAKKLLKLEGKVELKLTTKELLARRRRDVSHR